MRNPVARFTIEANVYYHFALWCKKYRMKPSKVITAVLKNWMEEVEELIDEPRLR